MAAVDKLIHPIPDSALEHDIAILGKKGRGKTYTAKGLVERLLTLNRRVLILDPLSVWWGLRASNDGKKAGFPIAVFGGPHADVEINEESGRALGQLLAKENLPAVIDMGSLKRTAQNRLVADLLDELFQNNREPLTIVLEEADIFAPQNPRGEDIMRVYEEVDRIARRGRAFGFRLITLTQRPARLNKDVLTQLSVLVALGITGPQDREAVRKWVEGNTDSGKAKKVFDSLAGLPVGEGWLWAPDLNILKRVKFPQIQTLDNSFTPKAGEKPILPKTLAEVDVSSLKSALQNTPAKKAVLQPIQSKQIDVNSLKLEAFQAGHRQGFKEGLEEGQAKTKELILRALQPKTVNTQTMQLKKQLPESKSEPTVTISLQGKGLRRALSVLVNSYPSGLTEPQWATLAGFKRSSGTWGTYKSKLRTLSFIQQDGKLWKATQEGVTELGGATEPFPSSVPERVEFWKTKLGAAGKLLSPLIKHYPAGLSKLDLANEVGLSASSGTFGTYLSKLKSNELVTLSGGYLYASDGLMHT